MKKNIRIKAGIVAITLVMCTSMMGSIVASADKYRIDRNGDLYELVEGNGNNENYVKVNNMGSILTKLKDIEENLYYEEVDDDDDENAERRSIASLVYEMNKRQIDGGKAASIENIKSKFGLDDASLMKTAGVLSKAIRSSSNMHDFMITFAENLPGMGSIISLVNDIFNIHVDNSSESYENLMLKNLDGMQKELKSISVSMKNLNQNMKDFKDFEVDKTLNDQIENLGKSFSDINLKLNSAQKSLSNVLNHNNNESLMKKDIDQIVSENGFITENVDNIKYLYNYFTKFTNSILGDGNYLFGGMIKTDEKAYDRIIGIKGMDIISAYENILIRKGYVLNTQTIELRREFINYIRNWYDVGYRILKTALNYQNEFSSYQNKFFTDASADLTENYNKVNLMLNKASKKLDIEENSDVIYCYRDDCYFNKNLKTIKPFEDAYKVHLDLTSKKLSDYMVKDYNKVYNCGDYRPTLDVDFFDWASNAEYYLYTDWGFAPQSKNVNDMIDKQKCGINDNSIVDFKTSIGYNKKQGDDFSELEKLISYSGNEENAFSNFLKSNFKTENDIENYSGIYNTGCYNCDANKGKYNISRVVSSYNLKNAEFNDDTAERTFELEFKGVSKGKPCDENHFAKKVTNYTKPKNDDEMLMIEMADGCKYEEELRNIEKISFNDLEKYINEEKMNSEIYNIIKDNELYKYYKVDMDLKDIENTLNILEYLSNLENELSEVKIRKLRLSSLMFIDTSNIKSISVNDEYSYRLAGYQNNKKDAFNSGSITDWTSGTTTDFNSKFVRIEVMKNDGTEISEGENTGLNIELNDNSSLKVNLEERYLENDGLIYRRVNN